MLQSFLIIISLIIILLQLKCISGLKGVNMEIEMAKYDIIPSVINEGPEKSIEILYLNGARVKSGNELLPSQVYEVPLISWKADPTQYYTLIMFDPDAPTRDNPKYANLLLWTVVNVPGNRVEEGTTLCEYIGAIPPPGTGLHRFIFLVYQQKSIQQFSGENHISINNYSARKTFSLTKFIKKYNLNLPIAGNFFLAEWDEYVGLIKEQFDE